MDHALNMPSLSPPIFRLNKDCCEELFDFLSLKDLRTIGQTHKRMQSIAGYSFQQNYSHERIVCKSDGISMNGVKINGFKRFVRSITIIRDDLKAFNLLNSPDSFDSLRQIRLISSVITNEKIACMKKILRNIERIDLHYSSLLNGDFYEKFLKFCPNLKSLIIQPDSEQLFEGEKNWLLRKYPKLEYFGLFTQFFSIKISELKPFLENNRSIKTLVISANYLSKNMRSISKSNINLDTLIIYFTHETVKFENGIFKKLQENRKFKKLSLRVEFLDDRFVKEMISFPSIEKLSTATIHSEINWPQKIDVKELHIKHLSDHHDIDSLVNIFIDVEKITVENAYFNQILAFVRHSPKLTEINVEVIKDAGSDKEMDKIDVNILNNERKKLDGARKIGIYVGETIYLATKWTGDDINQSLVQIKRNTSNLMFREDFHSFY